MNPFVIGWLVAIATAIWVGIDASNLGMRRGRLNGGFLDMGPAGWVFACLLLWIVAFPCYLATRSRYKNLGVPSAGYGAPMAPAQTWGANPMPYASAPVRPGGQPFAPAQAVYPQQPPPVSPDGRWWWDGQRWNPMPAAPPQPA